MKWEEEMKEVGEGAAMAEMRKGGGRATSSLFVCWEEEVRGRERGN